MRKVRTRIIAFLLLVACFQATTVADMIVLQAGNQDGFAAPADPASPSTALVDAYAAWEYGGATINFDVFSYDHGVAHTFVGLPHNIVDATLELRLRGMSVENPWNDAMHLLFVDATTPEWVEARAWARYLGELRSDLGLGSGWGPGEDATFVLPLGALPTADGSTFDLIPQLNDHGFLDVVVVDDTAVDYMILTLETNPVPEPSTLAMLAGVLLTGLAVGSLRQRKRKALADRGQQ